MTCSGWKHDPSDRCTNEIPALESRRVRTQPLTVTGASAGARPARISRTLNSLLSIDQTLLRPRRLSSDPRSERWIGAQPGHSLSFPTDQSRRPTRNNPGHALLKGGPKMRITRAVPCLLVTALLTLAAPPDSRAQAPATLLIKGATIIDGVADAPLRDRSLLIDGNTIRDVLPADAAAPAGAQVLDLSGKFIIPGLFDSHVHWEEYMGELF